LAVVDFLFSFFYSNYRKKINCWLSIICIFYSIIKFSIIFYSL